MAKNYLPFERLGKGCTFRLSAKTARKLGLDHRHTFIKPVLVIARISALLPDGDEVTHCPNPGDVVVDQETREMIKLPHTNFQVRLVD